MKKPTPAFWLAIHMLLPCSISYGAETIDGKIAALGSTESIIEIGNPSPGQAYPKIGDGVDFLVAINGLDELILSGTGVVANVAGNSITANKLSSAPPLEAIARINATGIYSPETSTVAPEDSEETQAVAISEAELNIVFGQITARANSLTLEPVFKRHYTSYGPQSGMSDTGRTARNLAARGIIRGLTYGIKQPDTTDPAHPRTDWDGEDVLPRGITVRQVNQQRRILLLRALSMEPQLLTVHLEQGKLLSIATEQDAYKAFFGTTQYTKEFWGRPHAAVKLHDFEARVGAIYQRLPTADKFALSNEINAFKQAYTEYKGSLSMRGSPENLDIEAYNSDPDYLGNTKLENSPYFRAQAWEAALALTKFKTSSIALGEAAGDRSHIGID